MPLTPDMLPTRLSLISKARSLHDENAWEELLGYYEPFITKILLRMGFRDADLKDVRQQVSLKLWRGIGFYERDEQRARFRNWLSTLIRNSAIDWIRSQQRHAREFALQPGDVEQINPEMPGIESVIEQEWQKHIVTLAVENLKQVFSGKALQVLALSLKGESVDAIAATLELRKESVYVLKTRVKARISQEIARLRTELEGEADE
jgi:RNA polymerase sigma factor (sigma-70 family)